MDKIHLEAVSNFNRILSQTYYLINLANQINDETNRKIMTSGRFSPIFVNLIYTKNDDENSDKKD